MWTSITQEQIDLWGIEAFFPIVLLLNYTLLQYLLVFYWKRRRERRVALLLAVALLGAVALIPFARPDKDFVGSLNDVSEACCVVTFLIQITIIGYDLNKKFKMRSVMVLTYAAELLILADVASILLSCVVTFVPDVVSQETAQGVSNVGENATLAFIFFFRFYYIGLSRGWVSILNTRKFELGCYLLFATHEVPFDILSSASGLNWEYVQAVWHRVTVMTCLLVTARAKIKRVSVATTNSIGPSKTSTGSGSRRSTASVREVVVASTIMKEAATGALIVVDGKVASKMSYPRGSTGRNSGPQQRVLAQTENVAPAQPGDN